MKINRNISQIRAEVLLNYLYPEMSRTWMVQSKGTFYRNYNQDILALYEKEDKAILTRDGFRTRTGCRKRSPSSPSLTG